VGFLVGLVCGRVGGIKLVRSGQVFVVFMAGRRVKDFKPEI
jgi:hypothetical protein